LANQTKASMSIVGSSPGPQFFRNMSSRATELMKVEMAFMGPLKRKDVEKAQHEIVEIVRQLEEEDVLSIGSGSGEDYVT